LTPFSGAAGTRGEPVFAFGAEEFGEEGVVAFVFEDDGVFREFEGVFVHFVGVGFFFLVVVVFQFIVVVLFLLIIFLDLRMLEDEFVVEQCEEAARMERSTTYVDEVADIVSVRRSVFTFDRA
jgi:hypothetical protein